MARARNIKPGFFRNADLVELSFETRLLFIGLWTLADREGRLEDRPKQIKMELFPADSVDCDKLLDEIAATGMLDRYEVDGKRYLQVVNFSKHQNPHRDEKASTIPNQQGLIEEQDKPDANTVQAPCNHDANTVAIGLNPESLLLNPDSLTVAKATPAIDLPSFVDRELWDSWVQCRKGKKISTVSAKTAIKQLTDWNTQGLDANAALRKAVIGGHQGLYAPDKRDKFAGPKLVEDWFKGAGFDNVHEARNAGCSPSTAHLFRNGMKAVAA